MDIDEPTEWQLKAVFDKFQRIIRNPEYLSFCEREIAFDEDGFDYEVPQSQEACEIRDKWGLVLFFDPSRQFEPQDLLDVFEESQAVQDEWRESEVVYEEIKGVVKKITYSEPIWDDHYIKLIINIAPNITIEQIKEEVVKYVKNARNDLHFEKYKTHHFDKRLQYYKVWDLRAKPLTFKKIANILNISEDKAKKNFQRAFELIMLMKYNKNILRELIIEKMVRDKNYKALADLEKVKQQHLLLEEGDEIEKMSADTKWYNDPEAVRYIEDIKKEYCKNCTDSECRDSFYEGDLKVLQNCPKAIQYLRS